MSSTRVSRRVNAPREAVYRALLDARAVAAWKVPEGMTCEVHAFDAREGGAFRVSLTYDAPTGTGKTTAHTDTYHGRFVRLRANEQVVEAIEFETADPALCGEMTVTISLAAADGGTEVLAVHEGLPPGVPPADNQEGWRQALAKLAALVEAQRSAAGELPDSARRVQQALQAAGIAAEIIQLPEAARTASDAAAAIGCRVEQIAKSLVFRRADTDRPVLVIASGTNRVEERLVASHLDAAIAKADADFVRGATGFAIGGVPPLGHGRPIDTLIDPDLLQFDTVWAAAGTPHAVFSIDPRQLVRATGARVLPVAASRGRAA